MGSFLLISRAQSPLAQAVWEGDSRSQRASTQTHDSRSHGAQRGNEREHTSQYSRPCLRSGSLPFMPVSIPLLLGTYARQLAMSRLPLDGVRCPSCSKIALVLTASRVPRGVKVSALDQGGSIDITKIDAEIAIARCAACSARTRVLPADILPRKTYSLPTIEHCCAMHSSGTSLRRTVHLLGAARPSHATLHGWTQGLGAHVSGYELGDTPGTETIGAVLSETWRRHPELRAWWDAKTTIRSDQFRSDPSRERLTSVARLFQQAALLAPSSGAPTMTAWRARSLGWGLSLPFGFRTAVSYTAIDHPLSPEVASEPRTTGPPK